MRVDENGEFWGIILGAAIGGALGGITADDKEHNLLEGIITGALLGGAVGAIFESKNGKMIAGGVSGVLSKTTTDVISSAYGESAGTWEDYAVAFIFGSISSVVDNGTKTALDVAVRPAVSQVVKMHTRGKSFDDQKYVYDVITRGISSHGTQAILQASFSGQVIKVDLGKCFFRATMKKLYSHFNGG